MRVVAALGGNALLQRGEPPNAETQRRNLHAATAALAQLALDHTLILTHGNGPQVGLLAIQSEAASNIEPLPLDILGAQTQGMIGYLIEDELRDELAGRREVATLLTQVEVDAGDSAFENPSKPIGPVYDETTAKRLARQRDWVVARDGDDWRRVVPSPAPRRILEIRSVQLLMEANVVVICAGGGGVPVIADPAGGWRGVEAVVDKDLSAALLAEQLEADVLLLLTDVDAVYEDWGTDQAKPIRNATPELFRGMSFPAGSMGPKVEAACRFVRSGRTESRAGDRVAYIGALRDTGQMLGGEVGTRVTQ